ncbi:uncharacterized protein N7506_010307 [Penicillium brevicompactum]|uniref:uncharacterized protein n=1 Tax=Penicillium brevicompactum TaxID=5074 RepID=UPI0025410518|nr:uncharacterized protein N7506_010307 [Penicillium brevicompactum]KAJ5327205.1 hypothetical protein N7506_010307 [Penicillium brevicompactum]
MSGSQVTETVVPTGSTATVTESFASTTTISVSVCSSLITNPTYTPASALPNDYTWGCPPGYLCKPPHTGDRAECDVESGLPDVGYVCSPENCILAPPLAVSNQSHYNVSKNYYNLNPTDFGLNYSIFQFSDDTTTSTRKRDMSLQDFIASRKAKRVDITDAIPPTCWDDCNDAALEPQMIGKTPALCKSDSAFMENLDNCEACVTNNADSDTGSDDYSSQLLPTFTQWLNYCSDMTTSTSTTASTTASTTTSRATTSTEASVTTTSTSKDTGATTTSTEATTRATITSTQATSTASATGTSETPEAASSAPATLESTDETRSSGSSGDSSHSTQTAQSNGSFTTLVPGAIVTTSVSGSLVTTSLPGSIKTSVFPTSASDSAVTTSVSGSILTTSIPGSLLTTAVSGTLVTTSVPGSFVTTSIPGSVATPSGASGQGAGGDGNSAQTSGDGASGSSGSPGGSRTGSAVPSSSSPAFNAATSSNVPHIGALSLLWAAIAAFL